MRTAFINNFETTLAEAAGPGATQLILASQGERLNMTSSDALSEPLEYLLTLSSETDMEIVRVTGKNPSLPNMIYILRGQEGTSPTDWQEGAQVEMRLTAGSLNRQVSRGLPVVLGDPEQISLGSSPDSRKIAIGTGSAGGNQPINIGFDLTNTADRGILIGRGTTATGGQSIAIGDIVSASGAASISIGRNTQSVGAHAVAMGDNSTAFEDEAVALGFNAVAGSEQAVALGSESKAYAPRTAALGFNAQCSSPAAVAVGASATANPPASVALGAGAVCDVLGGFSFHGLPYLPSEYQHTSELQSYAPDSTRQASMQVVIATTEIDLASGSSNAALQLPPNTIFLIDSLDWITTASSSPGGAPQIQVGTDDINNNNLLAATEITATGLHERQTFDPLHSNGVASVYVSVATAGTGTLTGKLVVRGYVMEV